ncbi:MAG: bi-domain-containing oxidoreductase [Pseudomonadota bacterium]
MKQILQSLKTGETEVADIPCPQCKPGHVLIETQRSLISAGTERMLVSFGKSNWLSKAKQQPDKVKQVLAKLKTDGILPTLEAVNSKLSQSIPMGYSNVGRVIAVGSDVHDFNRGDRVLSNGAHAEIVCVPRNLCAHIPATVSDDEAVFGVVGAIALQGVRLAQPEMGETIAVFGLGLLGLLVVQLLRANGCRVVGIDFDKSKLALAKQFGAETIDLTLYPDPVKLALEFSHGRGIDAVLVTASSKSNDLMHQAAQMSRQRGRIILVGVVGLELSRDDFYKKELTFQVSCSYGPGRYDKAYEEGGADYPIGFVRWTAQRNFEAVLALMADKRLNVVPLISAHFSINAAVSAYECLTDSSSTPLGLVIDYPQDAKSNKQSFVVRSDDSPIVYSSEQQVVVGFIGAGNYASRTLIPAFKKAGAILHSVVSSGGVSARQVAKQFNIKNSATNVNAVMEDEAINTIVIATQHDSHAELICQALNHGKRVYVEKPLAIASGELERIKNTYNNLLQQGKTPFLMIGFNRRFSPLVEKMHAVLSATPESKVLLMTVNAGAIPADHWTQNLTVGGGRIIGEVCHMIDMLRFLVGSSIVDIKVSAVGQVSGKSVQHDQVVIVLHFEEGSLGVLHYLSNGHRAVPKERLEVYCGGRVFNLDNFKTLRTYGVANCKNMKLFRQNKGQYACVQKTVDAILSGSASPISFDDMVEVTQTTFDIMNVISS